jgi:NitT/TauT family transport system ATP-binding protein
VDTALKLRLISLFAKLWQEEKKTVVFVTHDLEEALMLVDKIVVLKRGGQMKEFTLSKQGFPAEYGAPNQTRSQILSELLEENGEEGARICAD